MRPRSLRGRGTVYPGRAAPPAPPLPAAPRNGCPGKVGASGRGARADLRQDLPLVEPHESGLIGSDLVNADVVVAGIGVLRDGGPVPLGIRSRDDRFGHVVLGAPSRDRLDI